MSTVRTVCACIAGSMVVCALAMPRLVQGDEGRTRFLLLLDGEAVKDTVTGLVWEREPDYIFDVWDRSLPRCTAKTVGGRQGWRAPSIDEIKTLVDPDQRDPSLPAGHPFRNIKSSIYWTATAHPSDDIVAWQLSMFSGEAVTDQKSGMRRIWCVLDPPGH